MDCRRAKLRVLLSECFSAYVEEMNVRMKENTVFVLCFVDIKAGAPKGFAHFCLILKRIKK
jgi:hypothetical protein